jgi:hypothetical protein
VEAFSPDCHARVASSYWLSPEHCLQQWEGHGCGRLSNKRNAFLVMSWRLEVEEVETKELQKFMQTL